MKPIGELKMQNDDRNFYSYNVIEVGMALQWIEQQLNEIEWTETGLIEKDKNIKLIRGYMIATAEITLSGE